jgi:hypothetical protein
MAEQSLMDGVSPQDPPSGAGDPPQDPPAGDPPAGDPPADAYTPPADKAALDALIAQAVTEAQSKPREGVPEKPEDYKLPEIEGLQAEELESSNVFKTVRAAALDMGMPQDKFEGFVKAWAEAEEAEIVAVKEEQMALLGKDETAVKTRLGTLAGALQRMLPAEEANALMGAATSAGVVKALERFVNKTPSGREVAVPDSKDSPEAIAALMKSDAYMGREDQRDPAVIARVDKFFAEGGTLKS